MVSYGYACVHVDLILSYEHTCHGTSDAYCFPYRDNDEIECKIDDAQLVREILFVKLEFRCLS